MGIVRVPPQTDSLIAVRAPGLVWLIDLESDVEACTMLDFSGELQRRKLDRLFTILDRDKDGVIELSDYEDLGQRFADVRAEIAGTPADPAAVEEMKTTFGRLWHEYTSKQDSNGDGGVDRTEFRLSVLEPLKTNSDDVFQFVGLLVNAIFTVADANRDGKISRDEHVKIGTKVLGLTDAEAGRAFDKLLLPLTKNLIATQYAMGFFQFLTSMDTEARGNWLLGDF
jgi:Ca2+-binding EF-hand superfamily protein